MRILFSMPLNCHFAPRSQFLLTLIIYNNKLIAKVGKKDYNCAAINKMSIVMSLKVAHRP